VETAESAEPERPAGIPALGVWNPSVDKWEVVAHDGSGARDGECLRYRRDGTLFSRSFFVAGLEDGPFEVYHPDGVVAREGKFAAGRLEGLVRAYAPRDPGNGEPLRNCCVPPRAARLDTRYRGGDFLIETFYDAEGRALLSDGRLCPVRPAELPELAVYDESREGWTLRSQTVDRFWTVEGTLRQEIDNEPDGGRRVRTLDDGGEVAEEVGFGPDDRRRGRLMRKLPSGEPQRYADARIREVRGRFDLGQAVGAWTFHAPDGAVLRELDLGVALSADAIVSSPAFADAAPDWRLARRLLAQGRVREALVAAARAAVGDGDRTALAAFVAEHTVALTPELAREHGEALAAAGDTAAAAVLDELVLGADAAACFRTLASVLPATGAAAAEIVDAALLLAPERRMTHVTRALIRVQRGDEAGARADLAEVEAESPGAGAQLLTYLGVVFRPFRFSPAAEVAGCEPPPEGVVVEIAKPLEDLRAVLGIYATRIERARVAVLALRGGAGDVAWLPPDLSALLPDGPVDLRRETIECEPEPGDPEPGGEDGQATIEIDEDLTTDGLGVPALLALAHADYVALAWLCWAAGLDGVGWPAAVNTRADLAAAMQLVVKRHWRTRDRMTTGGLLAMSNNVPGFSWQGIDIDEMPSHIVETVNAEYLAARSMFLWLASPDTLSPFQDDIRDA
jgi:hypothetical protein